MRRVRNVRLRQAGNGDSKRNICLLYRELFKEHIFVGCVDAERLLIQHGTSLYAINFKAVSEEFFYQVSFIFFILLCYFLQTIVFGFGNLGCFKLEEPISLKEVINLSLDSEAENEGGSQSCYLFLLLFIEMIIKILTENAEMLHDYFSLTLRMLPAEEGATLHVICIPSLVEGFLPQLEGLPRLFKDIAAAPWDDVSLRCSKSSFHKLRKKKIV